MIACPWGSGRSGPMSGIEKPPGQPRSSRPPPISQFSTDRGSLLRNSYGESMVEILTISGRFSSFRFDECRRPPISWSTNLPSTGGETVRISHRFDITPRDEALANPDEDRLSPRQPGRARTGDEGRGRHDGRDPVRSEWSQSASDRSVQAIHARRPYEPVRRPITPHHMDTEAAPIVSRIAVSRKGDPGRAVPWAVPTDPDRKPSRSRCVAEFVVYSSGEEPISPDRVARGADLSRPLASVGRCPA